MDTGIQEKLIGYVIRGVTAAATGTGLAQVTSSTWIGRRVYDSFRDSLGVPFVRHPAFPDEVFEAFGASVLLPAEARFDPVLLLLLSAPLFAILGHVVYRGNLEDEGGGRFRCVYRRCHFAITLLLAVALVAAVVAAPTATALLAASALVALGGGLYLVLYCGDLRQKRFAPRFVWLALAIVFFANLVVLPQVYGQRFFDLQLVQVAGGPDGSSYRYTLTRPRLEVASGERHLLFDVDYGATGVAVAVELTDDLSTWRTLDNQEIDLRSLVSRTEAPALQSEAAVDREVARVLETIGATS